MGKVKGVDLPGGDMAEESRKAGVYKVNIETPLGPIRSSVTVETGPMRLAQLAPSAMELAGILGARAAEREKQEGRTISCGPGCGACCRQMVPLAAPEAFFIYDILRSLPENMKRFFSVRFDAAARALDERGVLEGFLEGRFDGEWAYEFAREYFSMGIVCPFLKDDSCAIYPYRPVACRDYCVTTPPERCVDPFSGDVRAVPMPKPLSIPLAKLTSELTRLQFRLIPLTVAPLFASRCLDVHRKTWPGLELFKRFIESIGPPPPMTNENLQKGNQS